jgi:hypothetical protein
MLKLSLVLFFLFLGSGCAHATNDDVIVLRSGHENIVLGSASADKNRHGLKIVLRAVNGVEFCRDASFKIDFDQSRKATIDFDSRKWLYRFPGEGVRECGDEKHGGYSLEFNLDHGSDVKELDSALSAIFKIASAKPISSDIVIYDDAQIMDCVLKQGHWVFSEVYNDFGTKLDDEGVEMKPRMPSVVFHVISSKENARCRDAYVLAFFPEKSKKIYFFVTSVAALPL